MVRDLANHDRDRAQQILDWPLREALLSYLAAMKREASEQYKLSVLLWTIRSAFGGGGRAPRVPDILTGKTSKPKTGNDGEQ